jgi:hypothetical protein
MEKDNSSVDNHAVICIFLVNTNWRKASFTVMKNGKEELDEAMLSDCDKWIFFGETMSIGKKNDHVFHNTCMDYIISHYDKQREEDGLPRVDINIIWTDNCPGQYKCRQNFYNVATFAARHNNTSKLIHKFGQKYRFKGSWDAVGKVVKMRIENNELKNWRCATAWDCYDLLRKQLTKDGTEEKMVKLELYESTGDERVLLNTTFTSRKTHIGYATEDKLRYEELVDSPNHYDHITFLDRSSNHVAVSNEDMMKLDDTQKLFQVEGDTVKNPITGKWSLTSSVLPCACMSCRVDSSSAYSECVYKDVRRIRKFDIKMKHDKNSTSTSEIDDPFDFMELTVPQLKEELNGRGIATPRSLKKPDLVEWMTEVTNDELERDHEVDC